MSETVILKPTALAHKQHKGHRSASEYIPGSQMTALGYNFHENGDRVLTQSSSSSGQHILNLFLFS